MFTKKNFEDAYNILKDTIINTNVIFSRYFSNQSKNNIYLKPENMQLTGSYKIRGALYKIHTLTDEQKSKGLVTASAGNHAQGVAFAASLNKISATIVMPTTTPLIKINNTKAHGASVILHGDIYDDAYDYAIELAAKTKSTFIHPFNDLDIATGQGTIALEVLNQVNNIDYIIVPIGGGGLAAGVATCAKILNPSIKVIGIEPTGAASMKASIENGKVTPLDYVETIADGVAVRKSGDLVFEFVRDHIDEIITIPDHELIDTFVDMLEHHKMVVENAGLLSVAALRHLNVTDKNIACILSGGNMDVLTISSLVQHGLRNRGRIFTFSVFLPDRPGELEKIAGIIAREKGNIIKLDHNQFVSINRTSAAELQVTLECYGHEHKTSILAALEKSGYKTSILSDAS